MKYTLIIILVVASLFGNDLEKGLHAYENHDYNTAFKCWEPLAVDGNSDAQAKLGSMYYWGQGLEVDYVKAAYWYRESANQGNAQAQNCLGAMCYHGQGVEKDDEEAIKWYTKSANQGHPGAQARLGYMCTYGNGTPVDNIQAINWYSQAIKNGHRRAKCDIAEPLLALNDKTETKQQVKKLLKKAYAETNEYQCKIIWDRYRLQNY